MRRYTCVVALSCALSVVSAAQQPKSAATRAQRAPQSVSYRLVRVSPDSARPGDRVRLTINPTPRSESLAVVRFNGRSAEVSYEKGDLLVRVPSGFESGDTAEVSVEIGSALVRPTGRVRILTLPLRILSVSPNPARPSDTVLFVIQQPFEFPQDGRWVARFESIETQALRVNPDRFEVVAVVPASIRSTNPAVVIAVNGVESELYAGMTVARRMGQRTNIVLGVVAAVGLALGAAAVAMRVFRRRPPPTSESAAQATLPPGEDQAPHPVPDIPADLISACSTGDCVLYVGAGLSAAAGFPTWNPFVRGLLDWATEQKMLEPDLVETLRRALAQGEAGSVADNIVNALRGRDALLDEYLRKVFVEPKPSIPAAYGIIAKMGFSAVLTTNFDDLLERSLGPSINVLTPADASSLIEALSKRSFFLLKLYGLVGRTGTVMVAPEQYLDAMARNAPFSQFMETLFFTRTILFVGASLEGIEDYLKGVSFREHRGKPHYALINVRGTAWQAKAASLTRRYGIHVLPYTASEQFVEVPTFLSALAERLKSPSVTGSAPAVSGDRSRMGSGLKKVRLENIGPFPSLELELERSLNIFLGDNGLGKSTILRAIAVALCGKDAETYAGRLIRAGETEGKIYLETERNTYLVRLRRRDGDAEVIVRPGRPLEAEGWLAVGFPPLRSVSWRRPDAPKPPGRSIPTPNDLLRLIKGDPDPRMDNLKQWLVDLDYMIAREARGDGSSRYAALREDFFSSIGVLTPGVSVKFKEVDPVSKQVTVITDDGEVPIESLSQGTTSLISWIGVLMQRMYEVYGDEQNPLDRYALVLIDEIDAHMHPEWQQKLVQSVRDLFRNGQFLATTHSPLIVGGLDPKHIVRLRRNLDAEVERVPIEPGTTMGRADQVLTSSLFDLPTTVDPVTQTRITEYQQLLGITARSPEQERRFRELEGILQFRLPMTAETLPERRAQELVRAILRVQGGVSADADEDLHEKAAALLTAVSDSSKQLR